MSNSKARSRNAQAQALLRSRRKVYIQNLEQTGEELRAQNDVLVAERDDLRRRVTSLEAEVSLFKGSLGSPVGNADALMAALETERAKVEKLREAVRSLALVDAELDEFPCSSSGLPGLLPEQAASSSSATLSEVFSSPADDAGTASYTTASSTTPASLGPSSSLGSEETDSLSLLLAQPPTFKRQAARMLVSELLSNGTTAKYYSAPSVAGPGTDQIDALLAHLFHDLEPAFVSASILSMAPYHRFLGGTTGPRLNSFFLSPACMPYDFITVSSDFASRSLQCIFPSSALCSARTISRSQFARVTRSHSPAPTRPRANALPIQSPLSPCAL